MPRASVRAEVVNPGGLRVPPTEFRLFRAGVNESTKGSFLLDSQALAGVMEDYRRRGVDVNLDYDHQSLNPGVQAPAAGWCSLEMRDGELWAVNVRWTDKARAYLEAGEFRYFSPCFDADPETGRIRSLINVAITNVPALFQIEALVAAGAVSPNGRYDSMTTNERINNMIEKIRSLADGPNPDRYIEMAEREIDRALLLRSVKMSAVPENGMSSRTAATLSAWKKEVTRLTGKEFDAHNPHQEQSRVAASALRPEEDRIRIAAGVTVEQWLAYTPPARQW